MVGHIAALQMSSALRQAAGSLKLEPGMELQAKVVDSGQDNVTRLAVGKQTLDVKTSVPLPKGAEVTIKVSGEAGKPHIQILPNTGAASPSSPSSPQGTISQASSSASSAPAGSSIPATGRQPSPAQSLTLAQGGAPNGATGPAAVAAISVKATRPQGTQGAPAGNGPAGGPSQGQSSAQPNTFGPQSGPQSPGPAPGQGARAVSAGQPSGQDPQGQTAVAKPAPERAVSRPGPSAISGPLRNPGRAPAASGAPTSLLAEQSPAASRALPQGGGEAVSRPISGATPPPQGTSAGAVQSVAAPPPKGGGSVQVQGQIPGQAPGQASSQGAATGSHAAVTASANASTSAAGTTGPVPPVAPPESGTVQGQTASQAQGLQSTAAVSSASARQAGLAQMPASPVQGADRSFSSSATAAGGTPSDSVAGTLKGQARTQQPSQQPLQQLAQTQGQLPVQSQVSAGASTQSPQQFPQTGQAQTGLSSGSGSAGAASHGSVSPQPRASVPNGGAPVGSLIPASAGDPGDAGTGPASGALSISGRLLASYPQSSATASASSGTGAVPAQTSAVSPALAQATDQIKPALERQQSSLGGLFAQVQAVNAAVSSGTVSVSQPVKQVMEQILGLRLGGEGTSTGAAPGGRGLAGTALAGKDLARAVQTSGIFREAGLVAGGGREAGDLKALLGQLRGLLTGLGVKSSGSQPLTQPAVPSLGQAPRSQPPPQVPAAQAAGAASGVAAEEALLEKLLQETDGALARLRLTQLVNRGLVKDDGPPGQMAQARPMDMVLELPVALGQETTMLQLQVGRDPEHDTGEGEEGRAWRLRFAMDLTATGAFEAAVSLRGGSTFVSLWIEREETFRTLGQQREMIEAAFADAGLDLQEFRFIRGLPVRMHPAAGSSLDRRS